MYQILKTGPKSADSYISEICVHKVEWKFPTNLQQHLKKAHLDVFSEIDSDKQEKKAKREAESTTKLAIFVGTTNVPNSIEENLAFKDLLHTADPRYNVPSRTVDTRKLESVYIKLKAKTSCFIQEANKISLTTDLWSKKGLTSSYLGIPGHNGVLFVEGSSKPLCDVGCASSTPIHTAVDIHATAKEVLSEWEIPRTKVSAILTDYNLCWSMKAKVTVKKRKKTKMKMMLNWISMQKKGTMRSHSPRSSVLAASLIPFNS